MRNFLILLSFLPLSFCSARPIVFNGDTLPLNKDFKKTQCGTLDIKENIIEVSGIACSRVTPGYIYG